MIAVASSDLLALAASCSGVCVCAGHESGLASPGRGGIAIARLFGPADHPQRCEWISPSPPAYPAMSSCRPGRTDSSASIQRRSSRLAARRSCTSTRGHPTSIWRSFAAVSDARPGPDRRRRTLPPARGSRSGQRHDRAFPGPRDQRPRKLVQEIGVTPVGRRAMSPMSRCRPGPRADGTGTPAPAGAGARDGPR